MADDVTDAREDKSTHKKRTENVELSLPLNDVSSPASCINLSSPSSCLSPSTRSHRQRRRRSDYKAKHWTYLFDTLRRTVDAIYETCRTDRSFLECREAIMILKNYTHDFETLIECLNVEMAWEMSDKTASVLSLLSPVKSVTETKAKVVASSSTQTKGLTPERTVEVVPSQPAEHVSDPSASSSANDNEEGWNVVRRGRRKTRVDREKVQTTDWNGSEARRPRFRPKCAMEIPQTKASMAKMAYSRRLLWEKKQIELKEKFHFQQRAKQLQQPRKAGSMPSLTKIGINFADPSAVRRSAEALRNSIHQGRHMANGRKPKYRRSAGSLKSLESIKEEPPSDPQPTADMIPSQSEPIIKVEFVDDTKPAAQLRQEADDEDDDELQHLTEEEESLAQEEESLQKEIEEEERKSIDSELKLQVEAEADEVEIYCGKDERKVAPPPDKKMRWQDIVARWQTEGQIMATVNWGELVEMELSEVRAPGEALQMHEKLSSPSRKRNPQDTVRRHEERLAKAEQLHQKFLEEKANRLKELSNRVEEVKAKRLELTERKRFFLTDRMEKAGENRKQQLQAVVRKAKDEEDKVHEIAFINTLEADNRRFDARAKQHDHEQRMQSIQGERQRKVEEKAAREAAAEERRRVQEEERTTHLRELAEKKRIRHEQIDIFRIEQEKERQHVAKEKARERGERIAELKAKEEARSHQVLHKIQQRQEESSRRHVETLELVKMRAIELSSPRTALPPNADTVQSVIDWNRPPSVKLYEEDKRCILCQVTVRCDLDLTAHLRDSKHLSHPDLDSKSMMEILQDVEKENSPVDKTSDTNKCKALRKRKQKLRQSILSKMTESSTLARDNSSSPEKQNFKMERFVKDLSKFADTKLMDVDVRSIERILGEIGRALAANDVQVRNAFETLAGPDALLKIMALIEKESNGLPVRSFLKACTLLKICGNFSFSVGIVYSEKILTLVDLLVTQLRILKSGNQTKEKFSSPQSTCNALLSLIDCCLTQICDKLDDKTVWNQLPDGVSGCRSRVAMLASYLVLSGSVDLFGSFIESLSSLDGQTGGDLIIAMTNIFCVTLKCFVVADDSYRESDDVLPPSFCGTLASSLKDNGLCGLVRLCYCCLFNDLESGERVSPYEPAQLALKLSEQTFHLLNVLAVVHRKTFQDLFLAESTNLEFGFTSSFLLSYCNRHEEYTSLLHETILAVGNMCTLNQNGQILIQSGSQPTILQQLCILPIGYFSDPKLMEILFPTLIACCYENEQNFNCFKEELSGDFISDFIQNKESECLKDENEKMIVTSFQLRFPMKLWSKVKDYFHNDMKN